MSNPSQTAPKTDDSLAFEALEGFTFATAWSPSSKTVPTRATRRPSLPRHSYKPAPPAAAVISVEIHPEEDPFKTLIQSLKVSGRAYPIFDIAQLILEKPERFSVTLYPLKKDTFLYTAEGLPFLTESEALDYAFKHSLNDVFETRTVETEAPKGHFNFIYKCPVTSQLITPPNYHKAQALLQSHHAQYAAHQSFAQFQSSLLKANLPEDITQWGQNMSRLTQYILKQDPAVIFESLEAAKRYFQTHLKATLVKAVKSLRLKGTSIETLAPGPIRNAIMETIAQQRRFPLDTVNHLRGRLRRLHFSVFKRSGIAYLCSIKRRLRTPGLEFAPSIQSLVEFLESRENIRIYDLPEQYLGVSVANQEEEAIQKIKHLMQDLTWLLREGYITEFSDGHLCLAAFDTRDRKAPVNALNEPISKEASAVSKDNALD